MQIVVALILALFLMACNSTPESSVNPVEKEEISKEVHEQTNAFPPTKPKEESVVTFDLKNPKGPDGQRVPEVRIDKHNPAIGPESAPVTWIIFAGWECPFSGKMVDTIGQMRDSFPQNLRIVFKHVFSPNHEQGREMALRLSMVSNDLFWEEGMELLKKSPIPPETLENSRSIAPLTAEENREARIRVTMDIELAEELGIRSTPQSIINGLRITGSKEPEVFRKAIQEALAAATSGVSP